MRRVAITGVSGYVGFLLAKRLAAHPEVEAVIGLDQRPPPASLPKLRFHLRDVTAPFADLFEQEQIDTAVHLAFVVTPTRNQSDTRRVNVQGTHNFLDACVAAQVEQLLYLGSAAAYGAHADNPVSLYENARLRPNRGFQYAVDKAATDLFVQEFAATQKGIVTTIMRGAVVLGPGGGGGVGAKVFQPVMIKVAGCDPQMQYLHEDDLTAAIVTALEQHSGGVFNMAADGTLRYSEIAQIAGRKMLSIPKAVLSGLMDFSWRLHLQSQSSSPGLAFVAYPWVVANEKFKRTTGFQYQYSSEATLRSYVETWKR